MPLRRGLLVRPVRPTPTPPLTWHVHVASPSPPTSRRQRYRGEPDVAAVTGPWSNGQTEGQISRLKTLKRATCGYAGQSVARTNVTAITAPLVRKTGKAHLLSERN